MHMPFFSISHTAKLQLISVINKEALFTNMPNIVVVPGIHVKFLTAVDLNKN